MFRAEKPRLRTKRKEGRKKKEGHEKNHSNMFFAPDTAPISIEEACFLLASCALERKPERLHMTSEQANLLYELLSVVFTDEWYCNRGELTAQETEQVTESRGGAPMKGR
jgi:hypothetical protein